MVLAATSLSACICTRPALDWSEPSVRLEGIVRDETAENELRVIYDVRSVPGVVDGRYVVSVAGCEDAEVRASFAADSLQQLELDVASPEEADAAARFAIFDLTPFAPELDEGTLSGDHRFGSTILSDSFGRFEVQLYRRDVPSWKWIAVGHVDIGSSSRLPWRRIGVVTLLPITVAADLVLLPLVGLRYLWAYCYYS